MDTIATAAAPRRTVLDMNAYQWTVLLAAWLGWGFDVFDGLLFNFVAPNCVPTLLHLPLGSEAAKSAAFLWTGYLTSLLLVGWAIGGVVFGRVADALGRTRTLMLTMLLYAAGTTACAFAPNMWVFMVFRFVSSLGIGGEWAAGASMVAEVVPEKRRVEAGALLYTSSPIGLFLATFVTYMISQVLFKSSPEVSWRYVFLCGLLPAAAALLVRVFVREPERWQHVAEKGIHPRVSELFTPEIRSYTISGLCMAVTALIMWWSCNAFIPVVAVGLAGAAGMGAEKEAWKALATTNFNIGGLIGTLLTIPIAHHLGRKKMFFIYFLLSAVAIMAAFGLDLAPHQRLFMYFPIGLTVFGIFGSFTFYLPELFPTRLRGTGAGFTYNIGRLVAAGGPFLVGHIATQKQASVQLAMSVLFWVGVVPLIGLLLLPFVIETRGRTLQE